MRDTIHWGIIGLGKIAHTFATDLKRSNHATLYGVASRNEEKAKAFADTFQAQQYYGSYQALAKDPKIDIIYIATPNAMHFENTMMCLEHGKAVLCEKPMGLDFEQVKTMIHTARSKKLFLMEAIWTHFIPVTNKLLELLHENVIGEIQELRADFGFQAPYDPNGRLFNRALGGGALMDIGIYPVYLSLLTLGFPSAIKATARMTKTGVDSFCAISFEYANSAKSRLESTFETDTPTEALIIGNKGTLKIHRRFHHSEKITLYQDGVVKEVFDIKYMGHGYVHEIEEVHTCLLNNALESQKLPHQLSLDLIKIMDQIKNQIGLSFK